MAMFGGFNAYDDEGSFLITLRDYLSGQSLYTQIFSIYGPLYYETMAGLFKLVGLEPGHDAGRFMTLAIWLIGSLAGGLAAYRLTRNAWLGVGAQLVTFHVLASLVSEPMHPNGLGSLLLIGLAVTAGFRSARPRATAALIGAIVGALLLIKINVGAFAAIAVAFAFAASVTARWKRPLLALVALIVVVAPLALTAGLLSVGWVFDFAVLVTLAGAAVGLAVLAASPSRLPAPSLIWFVAGGGLVVVVTLAIALGGGTRPPDLFNGLVVVALRLPQLYLWPVRIGPFHVLWAAVCFAAAVVNFSRPGNPRPAMTAGAIRVAAGFLTWLSILLLPSSLFLLALPLAWISTQAPKLEAADPTDGYARALLPVLAVVESLQAYPVAGTQLSLAALLLVPVGAISLADGIRQLRAAGASSRLATWAAPAAVLVGIAAFQLFSFLTVTAYTNEAPLGLAGAQLVRAPAHNGTDLRALVAAIDHDCSSFITFPGMTSFYIWTGQRPPVPLYAGVWMFVLDRAAQQSDVDHLRGLSRLCVAKNQSVIDFWAEGRPLPDRPLVRFIDAGFVSAGVYGEYELLVPASNQ